MKFELREDLVTKLKKLYQFDIAWCLEAGVSPYSDLTSYVNYLIFTKCEEENDFFIRRNEIKLYESLSKLPISGIEGNINFDK